MIRKLLVVWAVALLVVPVVARGQQGLTQSAPGDAIVYVEWAGADSMGPGYDQSHLKAILDGSQVRQLYTDFLPKLIQRIGREEREFQPVGQLISTLAEPMWKHPSAIYFGGIDLTNPQQPAVRAAVIIHAKADAAALAQRVNAAVAKLGQLPFPITAVETNGVFVAAVGQLPQGAGTIATNAKYTAAMGKLAKSPAVTMYVDVDALVAMVDKLVATENANDVEEWNAFKTAANVAGIKRFAYTGSFDGPDWADAVYVEAPAPRTGLAAVFDLQPIGSDGLAAIPQDATLALAGRFDPSRVMAEVRAGMTKVDPAAARQMDDGLTELNDNIGLDLERDLIDPMGDLWSVYSAPSVGGDGLMGLVLVNRLDDPAKVDQGLWQLCQRANEAMAEGMDGEMTVAFKQTEIAGLRVNHLAVPLVSPAWAVKDGNLYVGLYPQVVVGAANHVSTKGKTLATNEQFQAVHKRLNAPDGAAVQFIDMHARVPAGYASWLAIMRLYLGLADMWGVQSPAMVVPPLHVVMKHLSPAAVAYWSDDTGAYVRSLQPFPGSTQLATTDISSVLVGQNAMMVSILLPSLNRARETANRVKCAANMRSVGQGILLYANENKGKYPPNLGELLKTQDMGIEVFVCPSGDVEVPPAIRNAAVDRQAAWVNENASYVYVGAGKTSDTAGAEDVVLYEKDDNHDLDGMNFLYGDGHVDWNTRRHAEEQIQKIRKEPAGL